MAEMLESPPVKEDEYDNIKKRVCCFKQGVHPKKNTTPPLHEMFSGDDNPIVKMLEAVEVQCIAATTKACRIKQLVDANEKSNNLVMHRESFRAMRREMLVFFMQAVMQ